MIGYYDALRKVLEATPVLGLEEKPLHKCIGQVALEDVYTDINLPQTEISSYDGYALRAADIESASRSNPVTLKIIGTLRAGSLPGKKVSPGTAVRVMTGSLIPEGADCVVKFEDTDEPGEKSGPNMGNPSKVKVYVTAPEGNIWLPGRYIRKGALVMPQGSVIGPAQLSALTSVGKAKCKVVRRPVVAIIATGDELVPLGKPLPSHKSYNSNTPAVAALVRHYGGIPKTLGIARDREASLLRKLREAVGMADVIITIGGVSRGDYDLARLVLKKTGKVILFMLDMGPGRALAFGSVRGPSKTVIPVFCLPGPPNSCLVDFEMFVRPALLKMRGFTALDHPSVNAVAQDPVPANMRMSYVRFTDLTETQNGYEVALNVTDRVGMFASIATMNSFTLIPQGEAVEAGEKLRVLPLDWRENG